MRQNEKKSAKEKILNMSGSKWCPDSELNQGHGDFQSPALPTVLSLHMVSPVGVEPTTTD